MSLLNYLKNNFKNNLAAIKMEDLFYQPAGNQLLLFLVHNIRLHLENNANNLIAPQNAILLDSPIAVYINKQYKRETQNLFKGFTVDEITQAINQIQIINNLPAITEKYRIKSIIIHSNIDQVVSFYSDKSNAQVLLIDPSVLQLPIVDFHTLVLQSISSSMLGLNTLSLTKTQEIVMALVLSTSFGLLYNNFLATFVFDLAKQNQQNDNQIFLSIISVAVILYLTLSAINKDNKARATQQMFRLFPEEAIADINGEQHPQVELPANHALLPITEAILSLNRLL